MIKDPSGFRHPPWSDQDVESLNAFQTEGRMHPFTCPNRSDPSHPRESNGDYGVLRATKEGWICPYCDYTQKWAHSFMLNWKSW